MNRLGYFCLALAFACSPVKGRALIDAEVITVDSLKVTPSTLALKVGLSPPASLAVTASLSDGTTRDVAPYVTWTSSNESVATVPLGNVTAVAAGNAMITASLDDQTASVMVSVADPTLIITSVSTPEIDFFDAFAGGSDAPLQSMQGSNTGFSFVWAALPVGNELFVSNAAASISVFPLDGSGNIAPTRTITGSNTGLTAAYDLASTNEEIYVAITTGIIGVFPVDGSGDIAPTRTISGSNTGLTEVIGLTIHNNLIYVTNLSPPSIRVFPIDGSGDIAPVQVIAGSASHLTEPTKIVFVGSDMYVADGADFTGSVLVFPDSANGSDVSPTRWIHGPNTQITTPIQLAAFGQQLIVANYANGIVTVLPLYGTEDVPPLRTLAGSGTQINGPRGVTIY